MNMIKKSLITDKVIFNLDESSTKKYKLRSMLINELGKKFIDQTTEYFATLEDLYIMYKCINACVFENKLPTNPILKLVDRNDELAKGLFLFCLKNKTLTPKIKIFREKHRDTPLFIASALCHEMIHYYDFLFGPLNKIENATFRNENGKQMIGDYDSHGDYFQRYVDIAIAGGLPVYISYPDKIKIRFYMNGKEIVDENDKQISLTLEERAKMFYDAIKTDDLFIVEVKDDAVYVAMQ